LISIPCLTYIQSKLKSHLKLSITRLRMLQQKDTALSKAARRTMAQLLESGKEESARIRVENIIHTDINVELLEILELYCELLLARAGLLDASPPPEHYGKSAYCDPGLEEAICSVIYAAPRTEVKELQTVRALLVERFGKEFAMAAMENQVREGKPLVSERVVKKLKVEPPNRELVTMYLREIARAYGVRWPKEDYMEEEEQMGELEKEVDDEHKDDGDDDPSGGNAVRQKLEMPIEREDLSKATPPKEIGGQKSPVSVAPPGSRTDNPSPRVRLPGPPSDLKPVSKAEDKRPKKNVVGGKIPDVDELAKRFAALKK
jgi:vacuolar protein sorting-associated protein IST1